ncbi:MAG: DUF1934 domain-containing protein [Ruminiclostridium sp.]|nr:DUF1934 domain-containing protein [Ruminiclostridium sp.]
MKKNVCITIKSTQTVDEEKDTTELFTFGAMEQFDGGFRLHYDESEATGFEGSSVTLEVSDNMVTMTRSGKVISSLFIEKGKKHHCHYGTEFGDFMIGVCTDEIKNELKSTGGDVYLRYTLDINSSYMSENEMHINVKECN